MTTCGPALPGPDEWSRWRIDVVGELHEGMQSRVFEARRDGIDLAVKLTDAGLADRALLETRSEAVERLGTTHGDVVAPIAIDGASVQRIGDWLMTATPFVDGDPLDATRPTDAERLGRALARLHDALGRLPVFDLPPIRALDRSGREVDRSGWQLLHGDFSTKNIVVSEGRLRIFDFDDCGYGPVEYDVANSLYMELFDATVTNRPERYETFRPAFVAGYRSEWGGIGDDDLDHMIQIRVGALAAWLRDLPSAPIGIRTASPAWLATLAEFVESYQIRVGDASGGPCA